MELFISTKMVLRHTKLTPSGATRSLAKIRKLYNIPRYGKISVFLYCKHHHMDVKEFMDLLEEMERKEKHRPGLK